MWDGHDYTAIHAAVLFADLENSVMLSSTLSPRDYDLLVNHFQRAMHQLVESQLEQGNPIAEYSISGDQLAVFFYDANEVQRNYLLDGPGRAARSAAERRELIAESKRNNETLMVSALRTAIQLKNIWLTQSFNVERVHQHRPPLSLGIGLHTGQVYLTNRADGRRRIEGNTVNIAKRVESSSRLGIYSQIMFSQKARDVIRSTAIRHSLLRQRVFFHQHSVSMEVMKGVVSQQNVYELKFHGRLAGVQTPHDATELYSAIFIKDRTNIWAYYQLFEYWAYEQGNWERAFNLAKQAQLIHPNDEKVLLDLSKCYFQQGRYEQSREFAEQALGLNSEFDSPYEQLAMIAEAKGDFNEQARLYRAALRLSPNSPLINLNLGLTLLACGIPDEGTACIIEAVQLYPEYPQDRGFQAALEQMRAKGTLPAALEQLLPGAD